MLLFATTAMIAQTSNEALILVGYKSAEVGYIRENKDFLNFGLSVVAVDAKLTEKRANRNDVYQNVHDVKGDVLCAVFGLVGGTFDNLTVTGKMGCAYVDQKINNIQDSKKIYFTVGIMFGFKISDRVKLVASYDNVSSGGVGINYGF